MMSKSIENVQRILCICGFSALSFSMFSVYKSSPASGYEISVYEAVPSEAWLLLITAALCSVCAVLAKVLYKEGASYAPAVLLLLLAIAFFFLLPFIRGYFLHGSTDALGHYNFSSQIINTGGFTDNFYPVSHIIISSMSLILGIDLAEAQLIAPAVFSVLFPLFCCLACHLVYKRPRFTLLAFVTASIPLFSYYHVTIYPYALSILMTPFFLYIYLKASSSFSLSWTFILILTLLAYPFSHPVTHVLIICSLFTIEILKYFRRRSLPLGDGGFPLLNSSIASAVTFFLWASSFSIIGLGIKKLINWFGSETELLARTKELENVTSLGVQDFLLLALKMYGHILLLVLISFAAVAVIFLNYRKYPDKYRLPLYASIMTAACGVSYFIITASSGLVTWGRFLNANAAIWGLPILACFLLARLLFVKKRFMKPLILTFSTLLFTAVFCLSSLSVYRSPWILQPNLQITSADMSGANWFSSYRTENTPVAQLGWIQAYKQVNLPDHFGYRSKDGLEKLVEEGSYLILTERFRKVCESETLMQDGIIAPSIVARGGFNGEDFALMETDKRISKYFTNGEFEVYFINPGGNV